LPTVENLNDTHDIIVHRNSAFYFFRKLPSWQRTGAHDLEDGKGVEMRFDELGPEQAEYPGLGTWPKQVWWRFAGLPSPKPDQYPTVKLRLPAIIRATFNDIAFNARWAVPIDETHSRAFMVNTRRATGFDALKWRIKYRLWNQWAFMRLFVGQDRDIFLQQDYFAPERLSVTDVGIIRWRRLVTSAARAETSPTNGEVASNGSGNWSATGTHTVHP